ncbi:hypothetical protein TNIN_485081 [Trichonephila inaurata madagascariensis]|uniref:Uncharacterized protein n=1 Tax=Trichonephila inaurata madagascariensis TaxID=2747483 RepID=A0A8X6X483_9ARAC|nr:hypothetical protein TNIN_485081 [Trichonephila inaurata madagascariensis]
MKDLDRRANTSPSQEKKTAAITVNEKVIRKDANSRRVFSDCETDSAEDAEPTLDRQLRNRSLLQKLKQFEYLIMTDSKDAEPTSNRQLRNRSLLQKPKWFEDHIMEAESYLDDYNAETERIPRTAPTRRKPCRVQ